MVFGAHGAAIMSWAVIGLAGTTLLCLALSAVFQIPNYVHASGPFITEVGLLSISDVFDRRVFILLVCQAVVGTVIQSFARGAITWIALSEPLDGQLPVAKLQDACRAVRTHFPAMVVGSLVYSAITALAAVGLIVPLRELHLDPVYGGRASATLTGISRTAVMQDLKMSVTALGSPFAEFVPHWRLTAFRDIPVVSAQPSPQDLLDYHIRHSNPTAHFGKPATYTPEHWWITIGSLVLLVAAEMLRFRTVMALPCPTLKLPKSPRLRKFGRLVVFIPLAGSICFGIKHLWGIGVHVLLLRTTMLMVNLTFIIVPIVLIRSFIAPEASRILGAAWLERASVLLTAASLTVMSAIFVAFCAVYDARLYLALARRADL